LPYEERLDETSAIKTSAETSTKIMMKILLNIKQNKFLDSFDSSQAFEAVARGNLETAVRWEFVN
jgi:hypothetical protein